MSLLKKLKRKKEYPRKRRIWNHDGEPFYDALIASRVIYAHEIKRAIIKDNAPMIPAEYYGKEVNVLFYSKTKCEIELKGESSNLELRTFFIDTNCLDFSSFIYPPWSNHVQIGEYVRIMKDIVADDETRDPLADEDDIALVIQVTLHSELPYWLYNEKKNTFFRVKDDEIERLYRRLEYEVR